MKLNKLYQRATNQKINTFQVEIQGNLYRTITGFEDGVKTKSAWTECFGKNIGKSNETTDQEQAKKEAEALHRKKLELGFFENITDIDSSTLFKPMLAVDFNDYKNKITYPVYVQRKYDGIRCIVRKDGMWSRNGKKIVSAPHIFESIQHFFETEPNLILDGELYFHEKENFNKICSLVKKTKPTENDLEESKKYIQYHVYDVPSVNGNYDIRKVKLYDFHHIECIKVIQSFWVKNEEELIKKHNEFVDEGYEGLMIRINEFKYENKRSKGLLKFKMFQDEEFKILDIYEGQGRLQNKVGQMLFKTDTGQEFYSTVNGTEEYLTELWKQKDNLIGKLATIKYFELTPDGIPRFPKVINVDRFDI